MKRPEPDTPEAARRAQEAADWLVRRDRGLTAEEQDDFLQWLAADPRHGEWLALHRRTVGDFNALVQWRPEHSPEPNPDLLAPARRQVRWLQPVALAAAAALALGFVWWRATPDAPKPALEETVEIARRILEDGSSVELNHGAVVNVAFTTAERRATLVSGEALFTVSKDRDRPFIVRAGNVDVRAVGTAFVVNLHSDAVEVLVTEGTVAVTRAHFEETTSASDREEGASLDSDLLAAELTAGQCATVPLVESETPQIIAVAPSETARLLAWQPQMLDFSSAPLAVALGEFNRRNRVQFHLVDQELAAMPVVATIRSDNVEGFLRFLAATPGVQVERRGDSEIIVRRVR